MSHRIRSTLALVLLLIGTASLVFFLRLFLRIGLPQLDMKGVIYCWVLALTILLPISAGVVLWRGAPSWRVFAGCWLLGAALLSLHSMRVLPQYRDLFITLPVCFGVFVVPPLVWGLLLLFLPRR
jgi:hypothetical protein